MNQQDRAVTPVVSTIFMIAIVVVLAATVSVFFFGVAGDINEPAPNIADTTGEFTVTPPGETAGNNQIVRITHIAGESISINEVEIIVRASGPEVDAEARLVDLPTDSYFSTAVDSSNVQGYDMIDRGSSAPNQVIIPADSNTWMAGDTIQFRIKTGTTSTPEGADFRDDPDGPEADKLEVIIIHTPSNAIISENTFRP